jgi:predicted acyltransferase
MSTPCPQPIRRWRAAVTSEAAGARWASVDVLRGIAVAAMLLVNNPGDWAHVWAPLRHAAWHGFTPTDFVFPLFLFVVGVSLTLGFEPALERGASVPPLQRALLTRALRILLLGLGLHAAAWWLLDTRAFRPMGVLQRIGLCLAVAGLVALHARARGQWLAIVALLLGWWALLAGDVAKASNVADRIDTLLLGRFAYQFDAATGHAHDPEGVLSTLGALATTLLGLRAGAWLRRNRRATLWLAGAACTALGGAWSLMLPLNKALWTPSLALFTAGLGMLALATAHAAIDRHGAPALGRRFGVHALAVYAGAWLMSCVLGAWPAAQVATRQALETLAPLVGPEAASFAYALLFTAFWWLVARLLDARGWRLKL